MKKITNIDEYRKTNTEDHMESIINQLALINAKYAELDEKIKAYLNKRRTNSGNSK